MRPALPSRARLPSAVVLGWLVSALLGGLGCGGSQAAKDVDAAFRRIQLDEARIERADRAVDAAGAGASRQACAAACPAGEDARRAAEGVCAEASAIDDADARARCAKARARSAAIGAPAGCSCAADGATP